MVMRTDNTVIYYLYRSVFLILTFMVAAVSRQTIPHVHNMVHTVDACARMWPIHCY